MWKGGEGVMAPAGDAAQFDLGRRRHILALDLLRDLRKGDAIAALAQELAPARG
jgi:putative acyl-CoA dehydrogenase